MLQLYLKIILEAKAHSDSICGSNMCHLSRGYHGSKPAASSFFNHKKIKFFEFGIQIVMIEKKQRNGEVHVKVTNSTIDKKTHFLQSVWK